LNPVGQFAPVLLRYVGSEARRQRTKNQWDTDPARSGSTPPTPSSPQSGHQSGHWLWEPTPKKAANHTRSLSSRLMRQPWSGRCEKPP
jgi:hypothetical protein